MDDEDKPPDIDTLMYGFKITQRTPMERNETTFLSGPTRAARIVVSKVVVQFMQQTLDRVTWADVRFVGCSISCGGDWFELMRVTFEDCEFYFSDGFPDATKKLLSIGQGANRSLKFRK